MDTALGVYQPESAGDGAVSAAADGTSTGIERRWRRDDPNLCCWTSWIIRRSEKSLPVLRVAAGTGAPADDDGTAAGKADDGGISCIGSTAAAADRRDDDADVIDCPSPFSRLPINTTYCTPDKLQVFRCMGTHPTSGALSQTGLTQTRMRGNAFNYRRQN